MNLESEAIDDVLIRARRGELSEAEERRLREMLAKSEETRLLYEAGFACDHEAPVMPGDAELVERLARRFHKRRPVAQRRERRAWKWLQARSTELAAAVALLVAGAAFGAVALSRWPEGEQGPVTKSTAGAPGVQLGGSSRSVLSVPSPESGKESPSAEHARSNERQERRPVPARSPNVGAPVGTLAGTPPASSTALDPTAAEAQAVVAEPLQAPTARELFTAANRLRVQGDTPGAIRGYERLESEFPQAPETATARLSLGLLYLQQGRAADALQRFRGARKTAQGESRAHVLWGEAQALRALGRAAEERRVLQELLEEYPSSVYAPAAKARLTSGD